MLNDEQAKAYAGRILMDLIMPDVGDHGKIEWNINCTAEHLKALIDEETARLQQEVLTARQNELQWSTLYLNQSAKMLRGLEEFQRTYFGADNPVPDIAPIPKPEPPPTRYHCTQCGWIEGPGKHTNLMCRLVNWLENKGNKNEQKN